MLYRLEQFLPVFQKPESLLHIFSIPLLLIRVVGAGQDFVHQIQENDYNPGMPTYIVDRIALQIPSEKNNGNCQQTGHITEILRKTGER
jgi:hypothetical protein